MKSLIIYSSKYGCTKRIVDTIAKKINAHSINIRNEKINNIAVYDRIILGSSVYAGQINKKLKKFMLGNLNLLKSKQIGLFICGLNEKEFENEFSSNFPLELKRISLANGTFTGEIIFKKLNFFEKFIVKKIMKTNGDICKLNYTQLDEFISKLK